MRVLSLALTITLWAGCLSDKAGTLGETDAADTVVTDTGVTDTVVTDTSADSEVQDSSVVDTIQDTTNVGCSIVDFDFTTHMAPEIMSPYDFNASYFVVNAGRLLTDVNDRDPETGQQVQSVVAYTHGAEPVVLTESPGIYRLVDARGSRVLVARTDEVGVFPASQSLHLLDEAGQRFIMGGLSLYAGYLAEGQGIEAGRSLGDSVVTWLDCLPVGDGHNCRTNRVMVAFQDDPPVAIATITREGNGIAGILGPDVVGRAVVWTERESSDVPWRIKHHEAGSTRLIANVPDTVTFIGGPVLVGDQIYFNSAQGVHAVKVSGAPAQPEAVTDASCRMMDAGPGGRLLLLCNDSDMPPTAYFASGTSIKLIDNSGEIVSLATGTLLMSPKLSDDFVVWLSYPTASAGCTDWDIGEVYAVALDALDNPKVLSSIGIGCLCCGAYWPLPNVSIGADMVAWNYPYPGTEPGPSDPQGIGYAILTADVVCP